MATDQQANQTEQAEQTECHQTTNSQAEGCCSKEEKKQGFRGTVEKLKKELDTLIEATWNQGGKAVDALWQGTKPFGFVESEIDVIETAETIIVFANVPGCSPQSLDVSLTGNILSVKGAIAELQVAESDIIHRQQRKTGDLSMKVAMPVAVNPENVLAEMQGGVLKVTLAKAKIEQSHSIPIRTLNTPS